jgi:hypothetical protein
MRLDRTIMALIIAVSAALLPTIGWNAPIANLATEGASESASAKMAMSHEISAAMDEFCPDHAKASPCDKASDQCPFAFCAAQSVSVATAADFQFPLVAGNPLPIPMDQVVDHQSGSPPFRPPRV